MIQLFALTHHYSSSASPGPSQDTPASSACVQSLLLSPLLPHEDIPGTPGEHDTSSNHIGPVPAPYSALLTGETALNDKLRLHYNYLPVSS